MIQRSSLPRIETSIWRHLLESFFSAFVGYHYHKQLKYIDIACVIFFSGYFPSSVLFKNIDLSLAVLRGKQESWVPGLVASIFFKLPETKCWSPQATGRHLEYSVAMVQY